MENAPKPKESSRVNRSELLSQRVGNNLSEKQLQLHKESISAYYDGDEPNQKKYIEKLWKGEIGLFARFFQKFKSRQLIFEEQIFPLRQELLKETIPTRISNILLVDLLLITYFRILELEVNFAELDYVLEEIIPNKPATDFYQIVQKQLKQLYQRFKMLMELWELINGTSISLEKIQIKCR